jgi:hypothetical protein
MISTKIIRKRLAALDENKSVGPDSISGEILKLITVHIIKKRNSNTKNLAYA